MVALAAAAAQASVVYVGETPRFVPAEPRRYTVGVMCGGQIGPRLQGTIAQRTRSELGAVFACVGAAFLKAGLGQ